MKLDDVCEVFEAHQFPRLGACVHPEKDSVLAARSRITAAVADDEFLADCISWELRRLEEDRLGRGLVPFFKIQDLGVVFAFGYWPPGGTPGPHEHTAWTITAVCRNHLEVLTFDREESYRRSELVPKNCFPAPAGRVGFIYEPCIHEPRNTTGEWSLSLHVISPRDGEPLDDHQKPLPALSRIAGLAPVEMDHPYTRVMAVRRRQAFVHQLSRILATMDVPQAPQLLAQCSRLASPTTRKWIRQIHPRQGNEGASELPWLFARTHKDLVLRHRRAGDMVALDVETADGRVEEFVISDEALEAIAFVAKEQAFEVNALPGSLSKEEKAAIADVLEETGLFKRVHS